jgi:hypothetical protein
MTKNPLINALSATSYIILVVILLNYVQLTQGSKPDSAFAPVIFLSLLTFSVATMGYLIFYQPVQMLIDGKKREAVRLFGQTLAIFGGITLLISIVVFSGIVPL